MTGSWHRENKYHAWSSIKHKEIQYIIGITSDPVQIRVWCNVCLNRLLMHKIQVFANTLRNNPYQNSCYLDILLNKMNVKVMFWFQYTVKECVYCSASICLGAFTFTII